MTVRLAARLRSGHAALARAAGRCTDPAVRGDRGSAGGARSPGGPHRPAAVGGGTHRLRSRGEAMPAGWLDHAAGAAIVVLEPSAVDEEIEGFAERVASDRDPDRDFFAPEELLHPVEKIRASIEAASCSSTGWASPRGAISCGFQRNRSPPTPAAPRKPRPRLRALDRRRGSLRRGAADRRRREVEAASRSSTHSTSRPSGGRGSIICVPAEISAGFRLREPRVAVYAESEIFGEEGARRSRAAAPPRRSSRTCAT